MSIEYLRAHQKGLSYKQLQKAKRHSSNLLGTTNRIANACTFGSIKNIFFTVTISFQLKINLCKFTSSAH